MRDCFVAQAHAKAEQLSVLTSVIGPFLAAYETGVIDRAVRYSCMNVDGAELLERMRNLALEHRIVEPRTGRNEAAAALRELGFVLDRMSNPASARWSKRYEELRVEHKIVAAVGKVLAEIAAEEALP